MVEKVLEKNKKVLTASKDSEKAYDYVNMKILWKVLILYSVHEIILNEDESFLNGSRVCVRANGGM